MTTIGPRIIHIKPEEPQHCELCGAFEETRPYGANGEHICYACGEKNEPVTSQMMRRAFNKAFELMDNSRN